MLKRHFESLFLKKAPFSYETVHLDQRCQIKLLDPVQSFNTVQDLSFAFMTISLFTLDIYM